MPANARRNRAARFKGDRRTLPTLLPGAADRANRQPARLLHAYKLDGGNAILLFDQQPTGNATNIALIQANGGSGDPPNPSGYEIGPPYALQVEGEGWCQDATSLTITGDTGITFENGAKLVHPVTLPFEENPYT